METTSLLKHPLTPSLFSCSNRNNRIVKLQYPTRNPVVNSHCILRDSAQNNTFVKSIIDEFDPSLPVEEALTPPSSWYTDPTFYSHELDRIFYKGGWQVVGHSHQVKDPHDYFTGRLGNVEYVVCRDGDGKIHAFHNVCRHRASLVASGCGKKSCFVCPYHGWTYGLDGVLQKATKATWSQKFDPKEFGLVPLNIAIWGPCVVAKFEKYNVEADSKDVGQDWLGSCTELIGFHANNAPLSFLCKREYTIHSNWKVFCDNYLDGGYHIPYAHRDYASEIKFDTYYIQMFENVMIQGFESNSTMARDNFARLGSSSIYAFIFPNFVFERYGPWMCTNLVLPLGPNKCKVVMDFFLDASMKNELEFIDRSIKISDQIQKEDIVLCESVQRGLESPSYCKGKYVAPIEKALHYFHCLLHKSLIA